MSIEKKQKNKIMRFITYYRCLKNRDKRELRERVMDECGFTQNTFYYKMENLNWSKLEIDKIEEILKSVKNGNKKH